MELAATRKTVACNMSHRVSGPIGISKCIQLQLQIPPNNLHINEYYKIAILLVKNIRFPQKLTSAM